MSLIRSADSSTNSFGELNLYVRKKSGDNASLSNQVYDMDGRMLNYRPESYRSDYQQYFSRTPTDSRTLVGLSYQNSGSVSDDLSPGDPIDYDDDEIKSKLRELERELLMIIDDDWVEPMMNLLRPSSPKESSSDSNISSVDSIKEPRTAKQLLFDCAAAMSEDNLGEASAMITELRQMVSIQGDPLQRLSAYMVEGLAARIVSSGKGIYKALRCKEPPTLDRLSAMQVLFEICPCFKFGFMAANGAIVEAIKNEGKVHIIDFDVNQGSQYITLMQDNRVDDPETVQRTIGGLKIIGQRLEKLAEELGIPFEFRALGMNTGNITPSILSSQPGEALVVNFAFQLHHMPDESVSTVNQRDKLLRMVKGLHPKLVTIVEQDVNTNTAPFFPRFVEVYNYYSAVFKSLDAMPCRDIVNIVACEGMDRIERYVFITSANAPFLHQKVRGGGKWKARMTMAGFVSCPISSDVKGTIGKLLKSYSDRYTAEDVGGALCFGWEDKSLIVASAWK
ncbi:unnamed protein product [Spirodela intermedia]|uniref:Uncharacterized protein n=1 Tax=Spirodela intermedia TaxID=51605 RepID=A0A7I8IRF0_SPIIN|nr:unnamed protein product [Spirodela intermedia]CAA6660373.1 unnamed protein product [Spirodela intermedia]